MNNYQIKRRNKIKETDVEFDRIVDEVVTIKSNHHKLLTHTAHHRLSCECCGTTLIQGTSDEIAERANAARWKRVCLENPESPPDRCNYWDGWTIAIICSDCLMGTTITIGSNVIHNKWGSVERATVGV